MDPAIGYSQANSVTAFGIDVLLAEPEKFQGSVGVGRLAEYFFLFHEEAGEFPGEIFCGSAGCGHGFQDHFQGKQSIVSHCYRKGGNPAGTLSGQDSSIFQAPVQYMGFTYLGPDQVCFMFFGEPVNYT